MTASLEMAAPRALIGNAVHVWRVELDRPAAELSSLGALLDAEERTRAARFVFARDRARYTVAHAALRQVLGEYLDASPRALRFVEGPHGKPALAAPWSASGLRFNLSHSSGVALCAVTRHLELGVDVECIRPIGGLEALVGDICSPRERAVLARLAGPARLAAFFGAWTGKEAYVKAIGEGLSYPVQRVEVAPRTGSPARVDGGAAGAHRAADWTLLDVPLDEAHAGAVVAAGRDHTLTVWQWPDDLGAPPRRLA